LKIVSQPLSQPSPGLIELISRSIERSGSCTISDRQLLYLLWGSAHTLETKMRRLRLFASQHGWKVTIRYQCRFAVFEPVLHEPLLLHA
jgi:hypothetical protein